MKTTISALCFLLVLLAGQIAPATAQTYEIKAQDIYENFIVKKIWLSAYALPDVTLSDIRYKDAALPAGAQPADPETFTMKLGMERKRPFAVIYIPAYSKSAAGNIQQVSGLTLSVAEKPAAAKESVAAKATGATTSALATGTWYKIGLTQTGFYKVDRALLTSMGVDPATITPASIRVLGNGGNMLPEANYKPRPVDLVENAILMNDGGDGAFNEGDFFIFYGVGPTAWQKDSINQRFVHQKNLYSDTAYYFISFDSGPGLRIGTQGAPPPANVNITEFNYYDVHDVDLVNPATIGKLWYGERFNPLASNLTQNFNFDLGANASDAYLSFAFGCTGDAGSAFYITLNGNNLGSSAFNSGTTENTVMLINNNSWPTVLNSNVANFGITFSPANSGSMGYLDMIEINARRQLAISTDQLNFRSWQSVGPGHIANYVLQGANGNTRVWDVTNAQVPVIMNGSLSGSTYTFSQEASMLREFAAMNSTNLFTPAYSGRVGNQNLHGLGQVDNIIVTFPAFQEQANRLADYHRQNNGQRVIVITTDQIYNEFSSGAQDLSAIRDFARMFYKRAGMDTAQMPRYLTLFGGASYDYKNRVPNNSNFIPVFESLESSYNLNAFSTDDFYGFLDDSESIEDHSVFNVLDVAIGRLPARSADDAVALVDKIIGYKSPATLGPWRISSMFVADNNDLAGEHMSDAEVMAGCVTATTNNLYNEQKVYRDAIPTITTPAGLRCPNANAAISDQVFKGTFVINYNGHGNTAVWAEERILTQDDYNKWNNANMLPFMVTATCDFGQFDHPEYVSAAEQMLLRRGGGIISVLTTTAAVYADNNRELNNQFLTAQFVQNADGSWNAFGDASRIGKNATYILSKDPGKLANFRKFSLLGDPALTPDFPEHFIHIDSVMDGATQLPADTIKALGAYSMSGDVRDNNGNVLTGFNGILTVTIFDKPRTIVPITTVTRTFQLQDNIVYKGKVTVKNGLFRFSFIAPKDLNYYYGTGKISTYAQNGATDAAGVDTSIAVGGFSDHPVISDVPPIVKPYINDSLFQNGGITGTNTSLFVALYSETGINVTGNNLGHDLTAILDGNNEQPYILNDYYETAPNTYQRGYVSFPINGIPDGSHTLKVKAWDVNNNSGEGTVDFIVLDGKIVGIDNLMNYPNPFSSNTNFVFEHNHPNERIEVKINIYNTAGRLVKEIDEQFTPTGSRSPDITWDGTDNEGVRLPSGMYVYRMMLTTEKGFKSTAYQKLVIVR